MWKAFVGFGLGVLLVGMLGSAHLNSTADEIDQIRIAIGDLGLRVARLEHAGGVAQGPVDESAAAATTQTVVRSIVVAGIQSVPPRAVDPDDVARLQQNIDALQKTANFHNDEVNRVDGNAYYVDGSYEGGHYGYDHSVSGRAHMEEAQASMASRYEAQATIQRKQLADMQNAAALPLQIILGHDGDVIFTLRTKANLQGSLRDIKIGDTVTWTGERISAGDNSEEWEVSSIRKVERK